MIIGKRCFKAARTSSNVIKGVVISEVSLIIPASRRSVDSEDLDYRAHITATSESWR